MSKKPGKPKGQGSVPRRRVLAEIPEGDFDTEMKPKAVSPAQAEDMGEDRLELPDGALVAMRRSGGLRFTSRAIVIYSDGRVVVDGGSEAHQGAAPIRKLDDAEMAGLYRALEQAGLDKLPPRIGRQNPDAYAYELAARLDGEEHLTEVYDVSIPKQLSPLLKLLGQYLNEEGKKVNTDNTENMEVYRRVFDVVNRGDEAALGDLLAEDILDHNPIPGQESGLAGFKQWMSYIRMAIPDVRVTVEDTLSQGDRVAGRVTYEGTHEGPVAGIRGTGKHVRFTAIHIVRFENGKAVEWWGVADLFGVMHQIGAEIRG
ncbi:MAG: ester cyclase [Chloroflexia bacterium]